RMKVFGLTIDPLTNSPIMILKDMEGEKTIPIWIGLLEATAIAGELENIKFSRPMTHDLMKNMMDKMGVKLAKIEISDLRDNTYFAIMYLIFDGKEFSMDARPSDAIALALRAQAPIYVEEQVIQKSKDVDLGAKEEIKSDEGKKWTEILESLSPDDFGKYKM
ncbi:MAG TPA: bifunctional nuclease family protein, partial [Thermodesulfobacteriota bacterium]|nr:bifunctional nuclease family protein [Thermodesulfobacteriota bacterium]